MTNASEIVELAEGHFEESPSKYHDSKRTVEDVLYWARSFVSNNPERAMPLYPVLVDELRVLCAHIAELESQK